jgi:hypothetical protein
MLPPVRPSLRRGPVWQWEVYFLSLSTRHHHLCNRFGRKEDLRHTVAVESCAYVLPWLVTNRSDVRETIIGVAHDFDGGIKVSTTMRC